MLRNSDTATSRSRRLHIGKDTEGNIDLLRSPGGASSGVARPRRGIADPRGDIAGEPAAGYGRFRFHPNIIPRIIISASANSVRTAPPRRGAKNKRPGWF